GVFDVKPTCSGINQLIIGTMVGVLFAYTQRLRTKTAVCIVAAAAGISILTNILRIYTTVVVGQGSGMQHYFVTDHWVPGWILFGVGMFVFFLFAGRLTTPGDQALRRSGAEMPAVLGRGGRMGVVQISLVTVSALVLGPGLLYAYRSDQRGVGRFELNLPAEIAGWRAASAASSGYRPDFQSPDLDYERLFRDAQGHQVYLYVAKYVHQAQGKEAVFIGNRIYDDETWTPVLTRTQVLG